MPSYSPTILIALMPQWIVSQNLRIEVMCLEGGVLDMIFGSFEEEAVVIDELFSAGKAAESVEIATGFVVD